MNADISKLWIRKGDFHNRPDFSRFLNGRKLNQCAVEIGTHRGDFAVAFMECWGGLRLHCVDPWNVPHGYEEQAETLQRVWKTDGNRLNDMEAARLRLRRFGHRCDFIQKTSAHALEVFRDGGVDFVYIDGDHRFEQVDFDLRSWWTKIKPGGVLAGHDYICPGESADTDAAKQVQPAVHKFAIDHNLPVYLVVEDEHSPYSYYFLKPR